MIGPLRESLQTASWAQRHEEACIRTLLRPLLRAIHHLDPVRQAVDQRRARAVLRGSWIAGHGSGPGSSPCTLDLAQAGAILANMIEAYLAGAPPSAEPEGSADDEDCRPPPEPPG